MRREQCPYNTWELMVNKITYIFIFLIGIFCIEKDEILINNETINRFSKVQLTKNQVQNLIKDTFPSWSEDFTKKKYFLINVPSISDSNHLFIQLVQTNKINTSNQVCYFILDTLDGHLMSNFLRVLYFTYKGNKVENYKYSVVDHNSISIHCVCGVCSFEKDSVMRYKNELLFRKIKM